MADMSLLFTGSSLLLLLAFVKIAVTYLRRRTLKDLQGPPSTSFWLGNEKDTRYQNEVGDVEFKWLRQYGTAWRSMGIMGEEYLTLADPKALQYVLHTSGYHYSKRKDIRAIVRFITGDGLVWTEGEDHRRHRKVMNPAFDAAQLKGFATLFHRAAAKLMQKWKDEMASDPTGSPTIDITKWISRMTLDVIGEAGFDYNFGALDNTNSPLAAVYRNLFIDSTLYPSKFDTVFKATWCVLPEALLHAFRYLPGREYTRFRHYLDYVRGAAKELVEKSEGTGNGKDIISILLRANKSENPKTKLSDREVVDQVSTLLLAGHDTTAVSITWLLWELAKHPEYQVQIRGELSVARAEATARGDRDFSTTDLEVLPMFQAVLKEGMRLHPIVWNLGRTAGRDDVIPLAYPITTKSGEQISAIPISKGQNIQIPICAYNRIPQVWGEDADAFRPERFLEKDKDSQVSVGMYANLMNFSAGLRACIGWRFSVLEMQAMIADLIENFEFALPDNAKEMVILRKPTGIMMPMVKDHPELGGWMGLKVTSVR